MSLQNASSDVERLLVGNKCDLESKRAVQYETIQEVGLTPCDLIGYHDANNICRWQRHTISVILKQVLDQITTLIRYCSQYRYVSLN